MKVTMKGHKLEDAQVAFISLVDRGANRIPFRMTKAEKQPENGMNLKSAVKNTLARKNAASQKPEGEAVISAYVVQKEDNPHFDAIVAALEAAGINTENVEEREDGTVLFKQEEDTDADALEDAHALQLGDNLAITVKSFNPYSMKAASYTDVLKAQGFLPSLSVANQALIDTIMGTLYDEDATSEIVVSKLESALSEFSAYVTGLCREIPMAAFKAEAAVTEAVEDAVKKAEKKTPAKKADKKEPKTPAKKAAATPNDGESKSDFMTRCVEGGAEEGVCALAWTNARAEKKDRNSSAGLDAKALKSMLGGLLTEALAPVQKSLKTLAAKVDETGEALEDIKETAEDALELAEKNETAINGKSIGGEPDDDPDNDADDDAEERGSSRSRSRKRDNGELGIIDTAFTPHVRTRKAGYADRLEARSRLGR